MGLAESFLPYHQAPIRFKFRKYQVKPYLSLWFSADSALAAARRSRFHL